MKKRTKLGYVALPRAVRNPYLELDLEKLDRRICDEIIDITAGYRTILGKASSRAIAKRLDVPEQTIRNHLRRLIERDILIRSGSTNRTRYGLKLYVDYRNSMAYEVSKKKAAQRRVKQLETERVKRGVFFKGGEPATEEQIRVTMGGIKDCWNEVKKTLAKRVNPGHVRDLSLA